MSVPRPDVSIIVTVHNDPVNLVKSVASATAQSLRSIEILVVDDCSEDDSYQVARGLASQDERISVHTTQRNSGGPGGPRNVGLRVANAPWVTFLDSDDTLDEHAAERLFKAAEEDRADVACGQIERRFLETGEVVAWREELFAARRHLSSITEFLDLVLDSANGKLFRRAFLEEHGLAFLEGVAYEELVFSAQVYSKAESIAVVPRRAYIWNVYPSDVRISISNRRQEAVNLQHRIEAFERVLAIAADSGKEGLLERYQLKFLEHDAKLYLKDLVIIDDDEAERVLVTLGPELRRVPEGIYSRLGVHDRLLYGLALCGSVGGVREIKPAVKGYVLLEGRTLDEGDRIVWRPGVALSREPASGSLEGRLLELTGDEILNTPFPEIAYAHRVTGIELQAPDRAVVRGSTADPLRGLAAEHGERSACVRASLPGEDLQMSWPARVTREADQRLEWEFVLQLPDRLPYIRPMRFDLSLEFARGGETNASFLWLHKAAKVPRLAPRSRIRRSILREWFSFSRVGPGRLTLKLSEPHGRRGRLDGLVHRIARGWQRSENR